MTDPAQPSEEPAAELIFDEPPAEVPAEPVFPAAVTRSARNRVPIGPGLWEALLWIVAFFLVEIACSVVWVAGATFFQVIRGGGALPLSAVQKGVEGTMPWMIGFAKFVEVVVAVLAIRLRFGSGAFRATGFRSIPVLHAAVLVFAVLPTAFLAGQCFSLFHVYWDRIAEAVPFLRELDKMSSIESVQKMAESTPLLVLVLVIAVFPAINEEFMFRAAIGRGLLGRYGLVAGVSLTSMLFAAVHLSPVHAVALLPLAALLHVGYLSSGSVWWPVALHFFNNALSVAMMKVSTLTPDVGGVATDVTDSKFSPVLFLGSLACVAATLWLLQSIRVRWMLPDGAEWTAPFPGVEPPADVRASRVVPHLRMLPLAVTGASYALFPVAVVVGVVMNRT